MLDAAQSTQKTEETEEQAIARLNAMTPVQAKTYVNRLRRAALRQGLLLSKTRTRDEKALDYLGFRLTDVRTGKLALGRTRGGYLPSLLDVETYLLHRR